MSIEKFNSKKYITSKYFEDIGNILDDGFIIVDEYQRDPESSNFLLFGSLRLQNF